MRVLVTGGAGFIGSHLVDALAARGDEVTVLDNLSTGYRRQARSATYFAEGDILHLSDWPAQVEDADVVFHCAAIARTPWCIEEPLKASLTNAHGTLVVLEVARQARVKRVVLCSSNVVYAAMTPYRATKEMTELWGHTYHETYGLSVISLRFSNVYGKRQSEEGPSPNVFAALRKSKREKGYLEITGDGEQSRDFTHVSDIVRGLIAAGESDYCSVIDLCTGRNWTLNQVAAMFGGEVRYIPERKGDVKHIIQRPPEEAQRILGWRYSVELPDGIKDCLDE